VILVFGQTGQVARELALLAPEAVCLGRDKADLADPAACAAAIRAHAPRAVINAAAFTAVDGAEAKRRWPPPSMARRPAAMAQSLCRAGYSAGADFDGLCF
jgi:dTDP-4-dehydrorhamnose reductase